MKKLALVVILLLFNLEIVFGQDQYIFAYGGVQVKQFVNEIIKLTGKERPKICFLPTASGDNAKDIIRWYDLVHDLSVEPTVQRTFEIGSKNQKVSFQEVLLNVDAIVVGGGNTVNMMAVWKAQGIDIVLKKALEKGIVLAGNSAGSLCWFEKGITDSRPVKLGVVEGLGFLTYSNCPHYDADKARQELYHEYIKTGIFKAGYAFGSSSGIIFKNGKPFKVVSTSIEHNSYFVSLQNGEIVTEKLESIVLK
ncbi:peptidase E [Cellulophaga sp. F20128]|uniref:Type 1 glutamine amidotransferase-like domain-containing protein n=1 Tax=Cellulophaga sp. F20128 TaxID=2926413 RepID=UPI001FF5026D|nr:peptidase E [Cellulophaga sp. F20128]MCK0157286.1 peptidase E [Cellulophaga sp. F20128]